MNKKQKYLLFFSLIFVTFTTANFALALESKYPVFPGLPVITDETMKNPDAIGQLVQYFFGIGIFFSGAIALISLAIAGVQIIIGQANPEGVSNAKDRIKGSLLGLVLLMVSFLLIKSINPVLLETRITPLTSGPGVYYISYDNKSETTCPSSESDTSTVGNFVGGNIKYRCADATQDPKLLIWMYAEKDFKNPIATIEKGCEETQPIPPSGSFKIAFKTPGVYFYRDANCPADNYRSSAILNSGKIPENFGKIGGSIEFINNIPSDNYYGAILHERTEDLKGGNCQMPLLSPIVDKKCINITVDSSSATIFVWNKDFIKSGDGVDFYSGAYGWDTKGSKSGILKLPNNVFGSGPTGTSPIMWFKDPSTIFYNYAGSGLSVEEQMANPDLTKPGSIRIKGNYIVALYSESGDGYCQVFRQNVVDMKGTEYVSSAEKNLKIIYVIPTK